MITRLLTVSEEIRLTGNKPSKAENSESSKQPETPAQLGTNGAGSNSKAEAVASRSKKDRPAPIESAWRRGPPKAVHIPKEGLSAFAPPYSAKPVVVGNGGELQQAQAVESPTSNIQTQTSEPSTSKVGPGSVWSKGPPAIVKTVVVPLPTSDAEVLIDIPTHPQSSSQEVEIQPPTPSFSHLMPPASAWTVYSNDSDPAGPWDPAIRRQRSMEIPAVTHQVHQHKDMDATYPWGMPMMPVPMMGYEAQAPQFPGGAGVLWTPNGWAVQDAAMKRALNVAERAVRSGGKDKIRGRGNKSNYRSKSSHQGLLQQSVDKQNDLAVSLLRASVLMGTNAHSKHHPCRHHTFTDDSAYTSCLPPTRPETRARTATRLLLRLPPHPLLDPHHYLVNSSTPNQDVSMAKIVHSSTLSSFPLEPTRSSDRDHGEPGHVGISN